MIRIVSVACMLFLAFILPLLVSSLSDSERPFAVFGYLPEYRLGGFDYAGAFASGLTHLIFFSLEVDPRTSLPSSLDRLPSKEDLRRARAAADSVGGKLLLGFGGNGRSEGFGAMTATPKTRRRFLDALDKLLMEHELDGVDYNWEYPRSAEEWDSWGLLMTESRQLLLQHRPQRSAQISNTSNSTTSTSTASGEANSGGLSHINDNYHPTAAVVTFTMYLDASHYRVIDHFDLLDAADYVHCMAYDARGQHSTVAFAKQGIELANTVFGARSRQWTLGLPFYGRDTRTGEPKAYYELAGSVVQSGRGRTGDQIGSVFFNSHRTLRRKIQLAREGGAGGVMIWELGQDVQPFNRSESLMNAIREATVGSASHSTSSSDTALGEDEQSGGIVREEL